MGVVSGLAAIAFQTLGQVVFRYSLVEFAGFSPLAAAGERALEDQPSTTLLPWMIVVVMTIGGLISGCLVYRFAPEAEGAGTDAAIDAFHNHRGVIRKRVPVVKTLASAITVGTGGSGGQEGPIAHIGAGIGSWLGKRLNLSHRDRRIMLAAGMGAGVGAIFRAPLAGAVFAAEILYSDADLEADVIMPATTSSIVAYSVFTQALPAETRFLPIFGTELHYMFESPIELLAYTVLAVIVMLVGVLYVKAFRKSQQVFRDLPILPHFRPALGAALAGMLGIGLLAAFQDDARVLAVLGTGYGTMQTVLTSASELGIGLLLTIAFAKIATTALSIGSGGSGGVFGPSMVIGGCVGAAVGLAFQATFPWSVSHPEAFAIVGMAGFFAGVARAPISTIIMVHAMTGGYGLLVPTMLVTTLTFVTSNKWRLYQKQVPTRMDSKAHRGDFIIDVLEGLSVSDVFQQDRKIVMIPAGMTLNEIVHCLAENNQHYFPVVNTKGLMVGVFSDDDVRTYLYDDVLWSLVVAEDIMITNFISVSPQDDLNSALKRFTALNVDELPVIDRAEPGRLLGMLRRKECIAAYNRRLMEHKHAADE